MARPTPRSTFYRSGTTGSSLSTSPDCGPALDLPRLVVVLFELVAYRRDDDVGAAEDLEERDIARATERNDQFAQERALARFAARKRRALQRGEAGANGDKCLFGQLEIPIGSLEFAVENEVEQALQIRFRVAGQADPKAHRRVAGLRLRAASNLR